MKKSIKVIILLFLLSLGIFVFVSYAIYETAYLGDSSMSVPNNLEKIAIQSTIYDSKQNSISIYAQAMNDLGSKTTFNGLVFRNESNIETVIPISDTLNGFELTTLTFNLNSTLPSGTYTVTLTTTKGSSFVSPSFNVS